jgi:hypothetical protein
MTTLSSLLQAIGDEVVTEKDSSQEELTQHQTGKTVAQSQILASLKSRTPSFLAHTKSSNDDPFNVDPMTAMSSFETWDKQDGITGLVPQALAAYRSTYPMLEESIETTCEGHPIGTMVFLEMLSTSFLLPQSCSRPFCWADFGHESHLVRYHTQSTIPLTYVVIILRV